MNLSHFIQSRYSTKRFDPTKILSEDVLKQVKELLRFSPSSVNSQPWHFFIVASKEGREALVRSTGGQYALNTQKMRDASHIVLCCRHMKIDEKYAAKITQTEDKDGRFDKPETKEFFETKVREYINTLAANNELENYMAKQVYLNVGMLLMGLSIIGVDSVPVAGFDPKILDAELKLNEKNLTSVLLVPIGYRSSDDRNATLPKSRFSEADVITELY